MFKLEKEMTPIVVKWLQDNGFLVKTESGILHNCDVVGCLFDQKMVHLRGTLRQKTAIRAGDTKSYAWQPIYKSLVAIELKLIRISDVISQARNNAYSVTASYIAMPREIAYRAIAKARDAKVGVISVWESDCRVILEPTHLKYMNSHHLADSFWRIRYKLAKNLE